MDFLGTFVGGISRAKVLRLFLFNVEDSFTVEEVMKRAQVTKDVARTEIRFLSRLGVAKKIQVVRKGKKRVAHALDMNNKHVHMLQIFVRDSSAIDNKAITTRLRVVGRLKLVIASGVFVDDANSRVDLLVVADSIDERKLQSALRSIEAEIGRELNYASFITEEFQYRLTIYDKLIRDIMDYPHRVFLDKLGVTR